MIISGRARGFRKSRKNYLKPDVYKRQIQNVSWQIRYTGPGKTGVIAKSMGSGYQVQSWADQAPQQKLIKNKSIRIIPIESKWSAPSA